MNQSDRNELNSIVNLLGDVLVELQTQRNVFNRSFTLMLDKMDEQTKEIKAMRGDMKEVKDRAD